MLLFWLFIAFLQPADVQVAYVIDATCYASDRNPTCPLQIGIFNPRSHVETVIDLPGVGIEPTTLHLSADGDALVFQYSALNQTEIALLDLRTQTLHAVDVPATYITNIAASPDGRQFVYSLQTPSQPQPHDLTLYNPRLDETQTLVQHLWILLSPTWSPDGEALAFAATPLDAPVNNPQFDVHILNLETQMLTNLTPDDRVSAGGSWSSDGQRIAFTLYSEQDRRWRIATASADGADIETFASGSRPKVQPEWAFADTHLVYAELLSRTTRFWLLDLQTGERTLILGSVCKL